MLHDFTFNYTFYHMEMFYHMEIFYRMEMFYHMEMLLIFTFLPAQADCKLLDDDCLA